MIAPRRLAGTCLLVALAACSGGGSTAGGDDSDLASAATSSIAPALERVPSGSGAAATTQEPATTTTVPQPLTIGVIAPSAADDGSFTQSMIESLDRLDPAVAVDPRTDIAIGEAGAALQSAVDQGLDLIIAHGIEFGAAVRDVAAANPDSSFAWGPGGDTFGLPNVFAYDARADQGGYVLGTMAAAGSTTDVIGIVGSVEVADGQRYVDGFTAGAEAQRADIVVERTYTDSFDDEQLAGEAARRLVDRGADALSSTGRLSAGVSAVAVERGVRWFANHAVPSGSVSQVHVASQVYRWDVVIAQILDRMAAGTTGGERMELTLANGGLEVVFAEAGGQDPGARAAADVALAGLRDGSVLTGVD